MTTRDAVWDAVLLELVRVGAFRIGDLPFKKSKRHTVRRVLREMEAAGWLEREDNRAATWRMGEKAREGLNVSSERIEQSRGR
jgi:hypothetical protein